MSTQSQPTPSQLDSAVVAGAQQALRASESTGQQRMLALRDPRTSYADARELEVSPNLWTGWGWCAAAPAPHWWAATRRSPIGSPTITPWASTR